MTPDKHTNQELFIDVGDGHQLYVHDWGEPTAQIPIVFLHGGPGGGCSDRNKRMFDPLQQRVIFHDQRGSGRSLPYGSLEHNDTAALVEDIERIAKQLKLDRFVLAGGSWGSCLALCYGLTYPERVHSMVLLGIFTGSQREIDWLGNGEFRSFYPDAWQAYLDLTPGAHHNNPTPYHEQRILGDDPAAARDSAYALGNLEGSIIRLDDRLSPEDPDEYDPVPTILETYYMKNRCFMADRHVLKHAAELSMPIWLIQGRYDMVCPPITAYELDNALPNSELIWATTGHSSGDRVNYDMFRTLLLSVSKGALHG